jgi:hypothetical protein
MASALLTVGGIHLINSTNVPVAGGVATAAATTPFSLRPGWNPTTPDNKTIYSGGAPFSLGARPIYIGYNNVVERIPLHVTGSSHENAVARLQELKIAAQTALFSMPALLSYQPTSSSSTAYAEIYDAQIQELEDDGIDPIEGGTDFDFDLIITRAPLASAGSMTTLQNGITVTNSGTGGSNNTRTLGTVTGDLLYEGSPLNVRIAPAASSGARYYYIATVYQRTYNAGIAGTTTTSSTLPTIAFNDSTASITDPARARNGLRLRVMLRCTTISAKAQVKASLISLNKNRTLWSGPWVAAGSTGATQIDTTPNGIPLELIRRTELETGDVNVAIYVRSTDGTSVSVNIHSAEYLLYYTFCRIDATGDLSGGVSLDYIQVEQAHNLGGQYVPLPVGVAFVGDDNGGTDYLDDICDVRGTLPRAYSGASLYFSWLSSLYGFDATDTATVTTKHLPLYKTLRGSG